MYQLLHQKAGRFFMRRVALVIAGLLLCVAHTTAQQISWKLDKAHSQVAFSVAHLVISEISGYFTDFDVLLTTEKNGLAGGTIEATIKTASIGTGNDRRDNHLRSSDFLSAAQFPEMKFKSTKIDKTGDDTYMITGDLTVRDRTRSVVLDTKFLGNLNEGDGGLRSVYKATTTIDRFEFGTVWNKTIETGGLVAGKNVDITLVMEFTSAPASK
jgi:polyisoprenoid-binding protein YceI